jgi:hypothetical protein
MEIEGKKKNLKVTTSDISLYTSTEQNSACVYHIVPRMQRNKQISVKQVAAASLASSYYY